MAEGVCSLVVKHALGVQKHSNPTTKKKKKVKVSTTQTKK